MLILLLIFNTFFPNSASERPENPSVPASVSSIKLDSVYQRVKSWSKEDNWGNTAPKVFQELRLNPEFNKQIRATAEALYNRSVRGQDLSMQLSMLYLRCLIADQTYSDLPTILTLSKEAYKVATALGPCEEVNMRRFIAEIIGNPKYKKQKESFSIMQEVKEQAYDKKCWSSLVAILLNESDLINTNFFDVQESLILKLEAVDVAKKYIPNSADHAFAISECGKAYYYSHALNEAIAYWKQAFQMYVKLNLKNKGDLIRVNNDLGLAYSGLKMADSAEFYYTKAFDIAVKENSQLWMGLIQGNQGQLLSLRGKTEEAKKFLKKDFEFSLRAHEIESSSSTALLLSDIYLKENNLKEAKVYLDTSKMLLNQALTEKPFSSAYGVNRSWLIYYKTLGSFYQLSGQFNKSVAAYQTFIKLNDSLNGKQKFRELAQRATLQHSLKNEISHRKEKENLNQRLLRKSAYKTRMMITLIVILLIFFVFAFLLYRSREDLKRVLSDLKFQKEKIEKQQESLQAVSMDLRHSNDELFRLNQLKDKLFSMIAHDLRAPLNTVKGVLTLFIEGDISGESLKALIPKIEENVGETLNMLDNLLNWAKSQLDGFKVKQQKFELQELIALNFKLMASEARKKDVYMVNNLSGSLMVNADKEMINLVVRNLIHNAIKFTQPGDRIVADGAIIGNEVTLNLSDTGIGMTEEQLKNIFSRKMTTTNGTANEKGTGLGLQLCLDFIQMNKGKMEVHSRKGQGSVFSISLPVSEA